METQDKKQTKSVGKKFKKDGSFNNFPGNTIICPLKSTEPFHKIMIQIQEMYRSMKSAYKYSFLPPSSFHMTIFPMLCVKTLKQWNDKCHLCFSLQETDAHFSKIIENDKILEEVKNLQMQVTGIHGSILISVNFKNEEQQKMVKRVHKQISEKTGVTIVPDYGFHLTIAYKIIEVTQQEANEKKKMDKQVMDKIKGQVIKLQPAQYTVFEDMGQFVKYVDKTTRIELHNQKYPQ